ncbi:hypothetical protein FNV43_RR08919 [Rhamnella rubrinervis]|uniref:EndoU domain-containing protein n=1 Tax=Rhamnella rubrinervis TaxID=2594499 RepID=A0A8K0MJD2_9ROSA|nr:hypothetical protein FNV43_RR08919 [Rhamnella rubrinervis]
MDGLIKGLIDVALGHGDDRNEESDGQSRDERSRSSWAEVVSGEQDKDEGGSDRSHGHRQNRWNAEEQSNLRHEESENVRSKPPRRSQKEYERGEDSYEQSKWSRKEESEKSNDGWETVGRKPQRQPNKVQKEQWHGYKRPPSEQEYSDEVEIGSNIEPSEEELADLLQACRKLWELDTNRLVPGKDYEIDCGEGKKVFQTEDVAQGSLFRWLNEDIFRRPTFSRFCSLLDNYNPNAGSKEVVTSEEKQEQVAFIEEISRTAPIKYLHKYLSSKGILSENFQDFKRVMTNLWFDLYGRGGTSNSSSAFEHVFVGEVKQHGEQEVSGFHNWLQFYLEEAKGRVDYQGYIFPRRRGETPDSETQLLTLQFEWNGVLKSVSSTLVGVSPEFEIALYTLCFYAGGEDNHIQLGPYSVNIKCYRFGDRIGTVFPISEC